MFRGENKEISNEELEKICYEAVNYAVSAVQLGSTQFAKLNKKYGDRQHHIRNAVFFFRDFAKKSSESELLHPNDEYHSIYKITKLTNQYSFGNCAEIARLVFLYIVKNYPHINISLVDIHGGDHLFTILNLPKNYNFNEVKSLGNAFVCDAWSAWAAIHQMEKFPRQKDLPKYNRKYLWVRKKLHAYELYYCNEGILEMVPIHDKAKLKNDLDILFEARKEELLHPTIIQKLITNNGGHRPIGIVYPAREYKKMLKNYHAEVAPSFLTEEISHFCEDLSDFQEIQERLNSDFIFSKEIKQKMTGTFLAKTESLIHTLSEFKLQLASIEKSVNSYGSAILKEKIKTIENQIVLLESLFEKYSSKTDFIENYFALKEELENILEEQLSRITDIEGSFKSEEFKSSSIVAQLEDSRVGLHKNINKLKSITITKKERIDFFIRKLNIFKNALERFKTELDEIRNEIPDTEVKNRAIISHKLIRISGMIARLSNLGNDHRFLNDNYGKLVLKLKSTLEKLTNEMRGLQKFTTQELYLLNKFATKIKSAQNLLITSISSIYLSYLDTLPRVKLEAPINVNEKKQYFGK